LPQNYLCKFPFQQSTGFLMHLTTSLA
jgi:hypothetical protein